MTSSTSSLTTEIDHHEEESGMPSSWKGLKKRLEGLEGLDTIAEQTDHFLEGPSTFEYVTLAKMVVTPRKTTFKETLGASPTIPRSRRGRPKITGLLAPYLQLESTRSRKKRRAGCLGRRRREHPLYHLSWKDEEEHDITEVSL